MYEYYKPSEIYFSRDQCLWLIANVLQGDWPPEPIETGYTGSQKIPSFHAPFEAVCCVIAELKQRLKTTGEAGEALVDEIQGFDNDMNRLIIYDLLSRPAKRALNYISGECRRKQTYPQWRADAKRRNKNHNKMVKSLTPTNK